MVLLLAALVYMFIQYKMRQAKEPFDRPPRGMMTKPTTREVLQHLSHISVQRIDNGPRHLQSPNAIKTASIRSCAGPASTPGSISSRRFGRSDGRFPRLPGERIRCRGNPPPPTLRPPSAFPTGKPPTHQRRTPRLPDLAR